MTVGGEPFLVQNGLRQGCTIAPTLFILLVIDSWLSRCHVAGVEVQFKLGGKLVEERTRRPNSFVLSECFFVDDTALVCSCREDMVLAARTFDEIATKYGLTLSVPKTKLLVAGLGLANDDLAPLELNGGVVEVVNQFKYLGSLVEACGGVVGEVGCRIVQASKAFGSICVCCIRLDIGDQADGVPICSVGSVAVWCGNLGPAPRGWLVSWTSFTDAVSVAFWVYK